MPGLPGRLRFYPASSTERLLRRLPNGGGRPLFNSRPPVGAPTIDLVVGYGAGNVPGTALMIGLLAQATTLAGQEMPAVLVKNSHREPLFSPLVLSALEAEDPDLVCTLAVLVWDYEDAGLQDHLLAQAGLVIAAASDETIALVRAQAARAGKARFHAHGHKVSFSTIGCEMLKRGLDDLPGDQPLLDVVACWPAGLGLLGSKWLPVGAFPLRGERRRGIFLSDGIRAKVGSAAALAGAGSATRRLAAPVAARAFRPLQIAGGKRQVQVLSQYNDDYLVVFDQRQLSPAAFRQAVNDCQGRVIVVRPVASLMEIPTYLGWLSTGNLQSLSVATGQPGQGLTNAFLDFAAACGQRGVDCHPLGGARGFPTAQPLLGWADPTRPGAHSTGRALHDDRVRRSVRRDNGNVSRVSRANDGQE